MWDEIEPTTAWLESRLPQVVSAMMKAGNDRPADTDIDLFRNAYVNICAGNCFAMGLRYAGTADPAAVATLFAYAKELRATQPRFTQTGRSILESCVNVVLISLALVNAGTGDLATLRLIRKMHKRIANEVIAPPPHTHARASSTQFERAYIFVHRNRDALSRM